MENVVNDWDQGPDRRVNCPKRDKLHDMFYEPIVIVE